jgi:tetratricopeptide (TPR) repeat protein
LKHPRECRRLLLEERDRMRSFTVAEALLLACRGGWSDDPSGSEELAELALLVLGRLEPGCPREPFVTDLRAEAWGCIANCRRIRSDLWRVAEAFQLAETFLRQGSGNPLDAAGVLDLEASYYIDQRSFAEAEEALERLEALYREGRDRHREGRTLMQLAKLRREQGRTEEALPLLVRAGELVEVEEEPHLDLLLARNLAGLLAEAGRAEEARAMLPEIRRLARERADRPEWLRLLRTKGFIYQRLGHRELAASALAQARDGFAALGLAYDAALVGLELALLHLDAGDTSEVRALGAEMLPIFTSRGIHREALAALALVRRAMEEDRLTRRLVEEVMSLLRRAREEPARPRAAGPGPDPGA